MKIAAFNVKRLGWKKVNDEVVLKNLIKIVSRYSVVVMVEVVGYNYRAMDKFLMELNSYGNNRRRPYLKKCSEHLGRSRYKEQFVYFYRQDEVKLLDSFQYKEEEEDILAREPFVLLFECPNTAVQELALIPVHTKPEDTPQELEALDDVVEEVRMRWNIDNIMILGDFNADGPYLRNVRRENIPLFSAPYHWLIGDDVDTTTSDSTDHTYDRIVVFGNEMYNAVVPNSAKSFNFQTAYGLSDETTQAISDHYPVEVMLRQR